MNSSAVHSQEHARESCFCTRTRRQPNENEESKCDILHVEEYHMQKN